MKHVKETHGNITCNKFLKKQSSFNSRCLFKHPTNIAQNVANNTSFYAKDFQNTLTMRPVGIQGRSQLQTQDQKIIKI